MDNQNKQTEAKDQNLYYKVIQFQKNVRNTESVPAVLLVVAYEF